MPYFIFKINNKREYDYIESHDDYRVARNHVRTLRQEQDQQPGLVEYRMIFAELESTAEELLRAKRTRTPSEDD